MNFSRPSDQTTVELVASSSSFRKSVALRCWSISGLGSSPAASAYLWYEFAAVVRLTGSNTPAGQPGTPVRVSVKKSVITSDGSMSGPL